MISILVLELALYNQREHLYLLTETINCIYEEQDVCSLRKLISSFLFTSYLYESKHFILRLSFHKLKSEKIQKELASLVPTRAALCKSFLPNLIRQHFRFACTINQTSLERGER